MSPDKWKESKNPILTMWQLTWLLCMLLEKLRNEWNNNFWKEMYKSHETKGSMGWWSAKSLGITVDSNSQIYRRRKEYLHSIYVYNFISTDIHFPRFMKPFDKDGQKTNNDNVEGLEIK